MIASYKRFTATKTWRVPRKPLVTGHPIIRFFFNELNAQKIPVTALAERSGVHWNTIANWKKGVNASVLNLEACLNVLGFRLTIIDIRHDPNSTN